MTEKTAGIVLAQTKYSDSATIVNVFTSRFGRLAFMARGGKSKKSGRQGIRFQPLTILDLVIYHRNSRSLQTLRECSISYAPAGVYGNIVKTGMAIFLGEVLTSVLKEEVAQDELYTYLRDSIIYLDRRQSDYSNFHIAFLSGLCSFLGFEPERMTGSDRPIFDMVNGTFVPIPPSHGNYADTEISDILVQFFRSSWDKMNMIELTGAKRNEVLLSLLKYYSIHVPSLKRIKSLDVLKEVFSQ